MKLLLGVVLLVSISVFADVRKSGPYPVGVTTTVIVDETRTDHLTGKPRTLLTEIWYPADDKAKSTPKNHFRDFFPGGFTPEVAALLQATYKSPAEEIDKIFVNDAIRDAP